MPRFAARPAVRLVLLAAANLLAAAACGASPATPSTAPAVSPAATPETTTAPSATANPSPEADAALLLEVRFEGGFINPAASIGSLPTVVVDTTGRFYLPDTTLGGPMIPRVQVRDTGPAGAAAVLDAARRAGLADGSAGGGPIVADTGAAVVTLEVDGHEVVTRVAGPGGPRPGGVGGPGASLAPGATDGGSPNPGGAAIDLIAQLTDPSLAWGGSTAPLAPFAPTAYRVWVAPAPDGAVAPNPAVAWPLTVDPATFGAPAAADLGVGGLRSGVVSGADAASLASALAAAQAGEPLTAGGRLWQVWVSPVLPAATGG